MDFPAFLDSSLAHPREIDRLGLRHAAMDSSLTELKKKRLPCSEARAESEKLPQSHRRKVFPSDQTLQIFKDPEGIIDGISDVSVNIYADRKLPTVAEKCKRERKNRSNRSNLKFNISTGLEPKKQKHGLKHISNENWCNEVFALKRTIHVERKALQLLKRNLDQERSASSSAAKDAVAMIARLQAEKAAVVMEAHQFKRMAEERELHNCKTLSVLKAMLQNKEEETLALENEYLLATCCTRKTLFPDESLEKDLSPVLLKQHCSAAYEDGSRSNVECGLSSTCSISLGNNLMRCDSFLQGEELDFEGTRQSGSNDIELKELSSIMKSSTNSKDMSCVYTVKRRVDSGSDWMADDVSHDSALLEACESAPIASVPQKMGQQFRNFQISENLNVKSDEDRGMSQVRGKSEAQNNHQCDLKASEYSRKATGENSLMGNTEPLTECNVMHDVYEVEHCESNNPPSRHCTVLDDSTSIENRSGCYEKPDVPSEVIRSDRNQESSLVTGHLNSSSARNVYNSTTSSIGSQFSQLIARLLALESEKEYTKEAILALRKENEELKSLQEIAHQLQYLKKTVQDSKLTKEDSSFFSFLKGFKPLLPTRVPHEIKGLPSTQNGLSSVLEKCTDSGRGTSTVLVKKLKVREVDFVSKQYNAWQD